MKNLLAETLEILAEYGKDTSDVQWVGSFDGEFAVCWQEFAHLADRSYADSALQEVAHDLVVVGTDWWLERFEYGGSEWWAFKTLPRKSAGRPFRHLFGSELGKTLASLAELNPVPEISETRR